MPKYIKLMDWVANKFRLSFSENAYFFISYSVTDDDWTVRDSTFTYQYWMNDESAKYILFHVSKAIENIEDTRPFKIKSISRYY
jgi:hypothetical protein